MYYYILIFEIILFSLITILGTYLIDKLKNNDNKFLNLKEYLPDEELHSLRQIVYLILSALFFVDLFYTFFASSSNVFYFIILDVVLSLYACIRLPKDTLTNKIIVLLLFPFSSFLLLLYEVNLITGLISLILTLIHIIAIVYMIRFYYSRFIQYTDSNGLSLTILLLFIIIFVSSFVTDFSENVNMLDALVMVSNAFTSNGYTVLGNTILGKINSIILVWGGYLLSGVGTATLTVAILHREYNKRFDKLESLIEKQNDIINSLKDKKE